MLLLIISNLAMFVYQVFIDYVFDFLVVNLLIIIVFLTEVSLCV